VDHEKEPATCRILDALADSGYLITALKGP
jgi:hypothetical protein